MPARDNRTVLVLGAGLVARPGVRYLLDVPWITVTVASRTVSKAQDILGEHPRGRAVELNVKDDAAMEALIAEHDLIISLLPANFHVKVANACLRHGKHMATTSYISPEMRALHDAVKDAGLLFMNECGVDPGIDHMSAMRIFDDAWKRGGRITVFKSYCGGLPAPEANDNPMGYKFSWAPRGVLVAARNSALYKWEGSLRRIAPQDLLTDTHPLTVEGAGTFEAYPNRDSMQYQAIYGLGDLETLYRGTLRTPGHCARWKAWVDLGFYDVEPVALEDRTRAAVTRRVLGVGKDADLAQVVANRMGVTPDHDHVTGLAWLGMFDEIPLGRWAESPVDAVAEAMVEKASYAPGERDMIVMHHEVVAEFDDHRERVTMDLVDFGIPGGDSSMARTVSLPVAIAVRMTLEGRFEARGVWAPVLPEMYGPILDELETLDIVCKETTEILG